MHFTILAGALHHISWYIKFYRQLYTHTGWFYFFIIYQLNSNWVKKFTMIVCYGFTFGKLLGGGGGGGLLLFCLFVCLFLAFFN